MKKYKAFMKTLKSTVSRLDSGSIDIEGKLLGLEDGVVGVSKYKLESEIDVTKYVKDNYDYFKI